jgi:hypothetical protein
MARKKKAKPLDEDGGYPVEQEESKPKPTFSNEGLIKPLKKEQIEQIAVDVAVQLAKLGDTDTAVTATLTAADIKGRRNDDNKCPIANYLRKNVKMPDHVYVSVQHTKVSLLESFAGTELTSVPLPKGAVKFIEAWDGGKHVRLADVKE